MKTGDTVYGLVRSGQQAYIRAGEISSTKGEGFTVDYGNFHYSYNKRDIGRSVFLDEDCADTALERFNKNVRMGFYD